MTQAYTTSQPRYLHLQYEDGRTYAIIDLAEIAQLTIDKAGQAILVYRGSILTQTMTEPKTARLVAEALANYTKGVK